MKKTVKLIRTLPLPYRPGFNKCTLDRVLVICLKIPVQSTNKTSTQLRYNILYEAPRGGSILT